MSHTGLSRPGRETLRYKAGEGAAAPEGRALLVRPSFTTGAADPLLPLRSRRVAEKEGAAAPEGRALLVRPSFTTGAADNNFYLEMHPSWWAARSSKPVRRRNGRRVSSILTHLRHFFYPYRSTGTSPLPPLATPGRGRGSGAPKGLGVCSGGDSSMPRKRGVASIPGALTPIPEKVAAPDGYPAKTEGEWATRTASNWR